MDTDGTIGASHSSWHTRKKKARVQFATTSPQLAQDMTEILRSLGITCNIVVSDRRGDTRVHSNGRTYTRKSIEYAVEIVCPNDMKADFFRLERKKERGQRVADVPVKRDYRYQSAADIQSLDICEGLVSIVIVNDSHLFVAENHVVMHDALLPGEIT